MLRKLLIGFAVGVAVIGTAFGATFDGSPATPAPFAQTSDYQNFDVQAHSRDSGTWIVPESLNAQHGADCSAPPATHPVTTYEQMVYQCNNHFMTAINAGGYGVVYLTPNQMVDFSSSASIKFDLSTLRMSTRDWVDVWITPYNENLALPFDQGDVDLQGVPQTGIHIIMSAFNGNTTFRCNVINNFVEDEVPSFWWDDIETRLISAGRAPSATVRDTFQLDLTPGTMRFFSPTITGWEACNVNQLNLPFTRGVVQFGHHSYNPTKDNSGSPATWHWDNISIEPSVPFTIIHALDRYTQGGTVQFANPAPAGSNLRFAANGSNVQVNFGSGWLDANIQSAEQNVDRFKSYWTAIPAGTTSVQFRGTNTPNGPFFAQDMSIWALTLSTVPTATAPAPTATPIVPTATPSPVPATATPTQTPSPSSTPTSTATATRTPTSQPTSTPTPTPQACRVPVRQSNGSFTNVQGVLVPYGSGRICMVP